MDRRIFGSGAFLVFGCLQITRVVKENREQRELERLLVHHRSRLRRVASGQKPGQAKSPLEGMFEIVVTRVDRLVILQLAIKTGFRPFEGLGHKTALALGKELAVNGKNLL